MLGKNNRILEAFYDRGSTFPLFFFMNDRGSLTQTRRNANLVSKNDVLVYLGNGSIFRDTP